MQVGYHHLIYYIKWWYPTTCTRKCGVKAKA